MNETISIIVPIYNCADYIEKCVESILKQTYNNIEILLVDDGSTDNSLSVCKKMQKKDNRIKVLHKENGGVSSARNYGIRESIGDYVCFIDSDDWIDEKYCEVLMNGLNLGGDISVVGVKVKNELEEEKISILNDYKKINKSEGYKLIFTDRNFFGFPVNKLYKKSILNKMGNSWFNEQIHACEDTLFNVNYLDYCENIIFNNTPMYFYYQREGSATKNDTINEKKLSVFKSLDAMEKVYKASSPENLVYLYIFYIYNYYLIKIRLFRTKNHYKLKIKKINKIYITIMKSKKVSFKEKCKISIRYIFPRLNDVMYHVKKRNG